MIRVFLVIVASVVWSGSAVCVFAQETKPSSKQDYVRVLSDTDGEAVYEFTFPDPVVRREGSGLATLELPFFEPAAENGKTPLPKISYVMELPAAGAVASVVLSETAVLPVGTLAPAAVEWPASDNGGPLWAGTAAESGDTWLPRDLIVWKSIGKMRDIPLYQLTVTPFRYRAATGQVEFHKKIRVRVRFAAGQKTPLTEWQTSEVDRVLKSELINRSSAVKRRQVTSRTARQSPRALEGLTFADGEVFVRLIVDQNGIYKLDYDRLRESTGFDFRNVNPRTFRLFNHGLEVPIYVQGESDGVFSGNDYLEFYGEKNLARNNPYLRDIPATNGHYLDPWTNDNAYFLTWNGNYGLRLIEENGGVISTQPSPFNFTEKRHFEEDNTRITLTNINMIQPSVMEDLWAFDDGIAYSKYTPSTQTSRNYVFRLDRIYTLFQHVDTIHISLQGISTGNPHRVDVQINGVALTTQGQLTWSGKTKYDARIPFSSSILHDGDNTLTIQTPVSTRPATDSIDAVALNWFEISYKRTFSAEDDYVEFSPDPGSPTSLLFTLPHFREGGISVYKKGVSKIVNGNYRRNSLDSTWQVTFQDDVLIEGVEYVAVGEAAKLTPKRIVMDTSAALRTGSHNARYLIITPRILREPARRLHDLRLASGYTVETIDVEDIYDEFGAGVKNPYAIRDFLRFTYQSSNWQGTQGSPLYVTIIGDATDRPQSETSEYFVPLQHIQTEKYGPAASDYWFAMADDDDILPDFFIGRLPVSSEQHLSDIIDKIELYEESATTGDWKNRIQYIGGSSETRGIGSPSQELPIDVFRYQCNSIINNVWPPAFSPDRIYAYPAGDRFIGGANEVIDAFTQGRLIVNYLGHGGGFIWGDIDAVTGRPLLNNEQVAFFGANGGRFPLVLSMTCFVGAFDAPQVVLGELLLRTPGKGAIGVLASSGTGWIQGDYRLLRNSTLPLVQEDLTVGESIALGKLNYLIEANQADFEVTGGGGSLTQTYVPQSNVFQFNFLGDPALKLRTPTRKTITLSGHSPSRSETITVSGGCDFSSGSGRWEIYQMKAVTAVTHGRNEPTFTTLATGTFSITSTNYAFNVDLSQFSDTVLQDGYTGIRVFGETADGRQSFNAFTDFAVNATYISQIQTVPATITSSDSVRLQAYISDPDGIAYAVAWYDLSGSVVMSGVVDTMYPVGGQIYRSNGLAPLGENDIIRYRIRVFDGNGDSTVSLTYQTSVLAGIDLSLNPQNDPNNPLTDHIYVGGRDEVRINAIVENRGYLDLQNVRLKFYLGHPSLGGTLLGEVTTDIPGSIPNAGIIARDTVSIVSPLTSGTHAIYAWVDPDSEFNDINRVNNLAYRTLTINAFNVTPDLGTTYTGIRNDTVALDSGLSLNIPPGAVAQNTILRITTTAHIFVQSQPDLQLIATSGHASPVGYQLNFERIDELISRGKAIWTVFSYDTTVYSPTLYQDSIAVYRWDSGNKRWNIVGYDMAHVPGMVAVALDERLEIGLLALILSRDRRAPVIEPTIEGQFFSQGSIAPKNPKISAVLYDQNGVSLRRDNYVIKIDNETLNTSKIILADSLANSNNVTLTLDLPAAFEPGEHTVSFQARDVCGNISDDVLLHFRVVTKFDIKLVGNFPNPFANTTTFVFRVEAYEPLDRLDISIYTVSGRRIRRISSDDPTGGAPLNAVGYHEILWDATDDQGRGVANGIYFYKIKGRLGGKSVERRGKIGFFR